MKIIAFAFGCISVVLLAASVTLLSAIVLLGRPEQLSFAVTPSNIDRIGSFTPAPIPVTPQPAVGLPTVTPAIVLVTAPSDTPSLATLPPLTLVALTSPTLSSAVPTPTAPPANVTPSQVESSGAEVEAGTELPERSPEAMGPLNRREGNSIFISAGFDNGSTVEVVVTDDTVIYCDNTEMVHPPGGPGGTSMPPSDDMAAPEKMEPPADMSPSGAPPTFQLEVELVDSLAEISGEVMILAWGEQQENQLVAQCLVYHLLSSH